MGHPNEGAKYNKKLGGKFENNGHRHLGFLNTQNFNRR